MSKAKHAYDHEIAWHDCFTMAQKSLKSNVSAWSSGQSRQIPFPNPNNFVLHSLQESLQHDGLIKFNCLNSLFNNMLNGSRFWIVFSSNSVLVKHRRQFDVCFSRLGCWLCSHCLPRQDTRPSCNWTSTWSVFDLQNVLLKVDSFCAFESKLILNWNSALFDGNNLLIDYSDPDSTMTHDMIDFRWLFFGFDSRIIWVK